MNRDDYGSRTELDAGRHEHAHRPDREHDDTTPVDSRPLTPEARNDMTRMWEVLTGWTA
jgi:hypothetical protein